jgi:lysophospholipase L1-like esterase
VRKRLTIVALAAVLGIAAAKPAPSAPAAWTGTWGASPLPANLVAAPRAPISPSFTDTTLRQVVRVSAGGRQVRVRFSNEYGAQPLRIGAARVGLSAGKDGAVLPGSDRPLTFNGAATAVIPAGAPLYSDPVDMPVKPLSSLAISVYYPGPTGPCTCHQTGAATSFAGAGDQTAAALFNAASTFTYRAFLSGVEVLTPAPRTVVALGDSLTDGAVSTPDTNSRWPDRLAERLGGRWGVVNAGISGNRLLIGGAGEPTLARFDRDVLSVPGVKAVIVMIGTNDLGVGYGPVTPERPASPNPPTVADLLGGYRQLLDRAHAHGLKVYVTTIMPFEGAVYWSAQGDAIRQAVNDAVRKGGGFDGYVDFDAVWRDPAHPAQIKDGYHAPDHLHGTDAGYHALGDAVPLAWFK